MDHELLTIRPAKPEDGRPWAFRSGEALTRIFSRRKLFWKRKTGLRKKQQDSKTGRKMILRGLPVSRNATEQSLESSAAAFVSPLSLSIQIMRIWKRFTFDPAFQGRGIGIAFRKTFEEWACKNGASKYVIGVLKENNKARRSMRPGAASFQNRKRIL